MSALARDAASRTVAQLFDAQREWMTMHWQAMVLFPFFSDQSAPQLKSDTDQPALPGILPDQPIKL